MGQQSHQCSHKFRRRSRGPSLDRLLARRRPLGAPEGRVLVKGRPVTGGEDVLVAAVPMAVHHLACKVQGRRAWALNNRATVSGFANAFCCGCTSGGPQPCLQQSDIGCACCKITGTAVAPAAAHKPSVSNTCIVSAAVPTGCTLPPVTQPSLPCSRCLTRVRVAALHAGIEVRYRMLLQVKLEQRPGAALPWRAVERGAGGGQASRQLSACSSSRAPWQCQQLHQLVQQHMHVTSSHPAHTCTSSAISS